MPVNNNLSPVSLPMLLKFGEEPVTNYINNLESLNVELIDALKDFAEGIAYRKVSGPDGLQSFHS